MAQNKVQYRASSEGWCAALSPEGCSFRASPRVTEAQFWMTGRFKPLKAILPSAQQLLWPQLNASVSLGFVLYGGTAIEQRPNGVAA